MDDFFGNIIAFFFRKFMTKILVFICTRFAKKFVGLANTGFPAQWIQNWRNWQTYFEKVIFLLGTKNFWSIFQNIPEQILEFGRTWSSIFGKIQENTINYFLQNFTCFCIFPNVFFSSEFCPKKAGTTLLSPHFFQLCKEMITTAWIYLQGCTAWSLKTG